MFSSTNLKAAIQNRLENEDYLANFVKHGEYDIKTGETKIAIAARSPAADGIVPYIGFEILDTEPLVKDDPTLRHYTSIIFIYAVTEEEPKTTILADYIQSMFTIRPEGEDRSWYLDFSSDCVYNRYTRFISRLRFGREGQNLYDENTRTWTEVVEAKLWWIDSGCEVCCTTYAPEEPEDEPSGVVCDC